MIFASLKLYLETRQKEVLLIVSIELIQIVVEIVMHIVELHGDHIVRVPVEAPVESIVIHPHGLIPGQQFPGAQVSFPRLIVKDSFDLFEPCRRSSLVGLVFTSQEETAVHIKPIGIQVSSLPSHPEIDPVLPAFAGAALPRD